jgi:hypothetical protein
VTAQERDELLAFPSWKAVKNESPRWTGVVEAMAQEYNLLLVDFYAKAPPDEGDPREPGRARLPPLFRLRHEGGRDEGGRDEGEGPASDTFYMCAAIAEPKDGRFFVIVDPAAVRAGARGAVPAPASVPELRPALTKCTVLWRGRAAVEGGRLPVAKVLLQPWTVRTHYLRRWPG